MALAEMSMSSGLGVKIEKPKKLLNLFQYYYGEDQGRYIIEIEKKDFKSVLEILNKNSVHYDELGNVTEKDLVIDDKTKVSIDDLVKSNTTWLINYMSK